MLQRCCCRHQTIIHRYNAIQKIHERQPASLLRACAALLQPDANCSVEWRCEALSAMGRAVDAFLARDSDNDEAHAGLWAADVLQPLFFTLLHDPSIRVG